MISPGAALRTHYAIALLLRQGIPWHAAEVPVAGENPTPQEGAFSPPVPVSVVTTPYPSRRSSVVKLYWTPSSTQTVKSRS